PSSTFGCDLVGRLGVSVSRTKHRRSNARHVAMTGRNRRTVFEAAAASNCRTAGRGSWTLARQLGNLPLAYGVVIGSLRRPSGPAVFLARSRVTRVIPRTI